MQTNDRLIRQSGLVDETKLDTPLSIVGAGSIGSWTTLALTKMGLNKIVVVDMDKVEEHNLGAQIYGLADVGNLKASALKEYIFLNSNEEIGDYIGEVSAGKTNTLIQPNQSILISAVDNMTTRKFMFEDWSKRLSSLLPFAYLIDGRMAANAIDIFCVNMKDEKAREAYAKTLFTDEEADPTPCSERAVAYNVFVVAGIISDMVAQILNGKTPPQEIEIDLANFAMYGGL